MNIIAADQNLTMSSLDFLENIINPSRVSCGESEVRNNVFFHRVVDELDLDKSTCKDFVCTSHSRNRTYTAKGFELDQDQMMLVGMRESKAVRKNVLAKIKQLTSNAPQIPQTLSEALQLAANQAKALELAAPKVAFVDNLVDRTSLMNASQVAQKHKKSAIWLNKILTELKVYNKAVKRGKVFQQWFVDKGYGEMKQSEEGYSQAMFTNAGEVWINEKLHTEGIV
ncbi:coil containing protein [Vibrio phage 1.216.O._10N.222.55.C12]|nr:coil containing protein [Vibrio phage 1.216.O._10N.222.55.C12]